MPRAEARAAIGPPLTVLPKALREPRRPIAAIAVGWLTAFLPSLLLSAVVRNLLPELEEPAIAIDGAYTLALVVIVSPILETLIMAGVLALLLRLAPPTLAILISSIGWGFAHSWLAPAWGLVIWWPFLVFSTLFVTWRQRSIVAALAIPAAVHALQNSVPALALLLGR